MNMSRDLVDSMVTLVNTYFRFAKTIVIKFLTIKNKQNLCKAMSMFLALHLANHLIVYPDIKRACYLS